MDSVLTNIIQALEETLVFREPKRTNRLAQEAKRVQQRFDRPPKVPRSIDLDLVLADVQMSFQQSGPECVYTLTRRDKNWIPWILFRGPDPQPINWPGFLDAAINDLRKRGKWSRLSSWVHVYFLNFDRKSNNIKRLSKFIEQSLAEYHGKLPRLVAWKHRSALLFSSAAMANTWTWLLDQDASTDDAFHSIGLEGDLANCPFTTELINTGIEFCSQNLPEGLSRVAEMLEIPGDRGPEIRNLTCTKSAASEIIPAGARKPSVRLDRALYPVFLRHLRDPRMPGGRTRWSGVAPTAIDSFTHWLAREDLAFFFSLVERTANAKQWTQREDFWKGYLPHIQMTWIILGKHARELAGGIKTMQDTLRFRDYGRLYKGTHGQSIFLIEMGGHVFAEWSHDGACGIWDADEAPFKLGDNEYLAPDLRAPKDKPHRIVHLPEGAWQGAAHRKIKRLTQLDPHTSTTRRRSHRNSTSSQKVNPKATANERTERNSMGSVVLTILATEGPMTVTELRVRSLHVMKLNLSKLLVSDLNKEIYKEITHNKIRFKDNDSGQDFQNRTVEATGRK